MNLDLSDTTIHNFPRAFINKRGQATLIQTLTPGQRQQLIEMYLAYKPRNSFGGLPPIRDSLCVDWVIGMIDTAANLVALSFDVGIVGHAALFPIDADKCEILLVVSPPQQQIGIGTEMTRSLIQLADELGFEHISLTVETRNKVARHVYQKCGFAYSCQGFRDELDMAMDLKSYRSSLEAPVREIMTRSVISIKQETPCRTALHMFLENGIATLPVVDEDNCLKGVLTETDLLIEANIPKKAADVLTREVVSVQDGYSIANVISLFSSRKLRCIPVLDRHMKLVGVVSRRDILTHYRERLDTSGDMFQDCSRILAGEA
jgi:acetoin utilization protein AcuB